MDRVSRISFEPSRAIGSVGRWIRAALKADAPVSRAQMEAWADGAEQAAARAREVEAQLADAGGSPRERIDETTATAIYESALTRIVRLSVHAQQAATLAELKEIDADATFLVDALEALGLGVVRPPETTTLKGA